MQKLLNCGVSNEYENYHTYALLSFICFLKQAEHTIFTFFPTCHFPSSQRYKERRILQCQAIITNLYQP